MAAFSGKEGTILAGASNELAELLSWELEYGFEPHSYASRAGGGAMQTVAGVESGSGTITLNFDATDPIQAILPHGGLVSLTLTTAQGRTCTGTARIGKHRYEVNLSGEPERVVVPFVTHGAWTLPST